MPSQQKILLRFSCCLCCDKTNKVIILVMRIINTYKIYVSADCAYSALNIINSLSINNLLSDLTSIIHKRNIKELFVDLMLLSNGESLT